MKTESDQAPRSPKEVEQTRESLSPELAPGRVLIVEDEADLAEILEFNLRRQGFVTHVAYDGLSACRLIGSEQPELLLLDLNLPDLDGWEICRMVRSQPNPEQAQVPIIMLTAMSTPENRVRGIELGADIYLSKPYSIKEVLLHVRQLITRRRRQQQLEQELNQLQTTMTREKNRQQMLVHELRNQLLVISGYSFRLDSRRQDFNPQRSRKYLQAINRSSNYLSSLAEEFMLIRQVESEDCQLPKIPTNPLWPVEEMVDLYQLTAQDQGKRLELHSQAVSPQDLNRTAFKMILSNLLENAVKYSRTGGRIDVYLEATVTGLELRVEDDGPGIAPDELEHIFDKFYRSPKLNDTLTGTGLGLYTARTLTGAMGGSIVAHNRPQGGACFVVSLPS